MDIADLGQAREEMDRAAAIRHALLHVPPLPYTGVCYNCLSNVPQGVRFCDAECRNDYDYRARVEGLHGIR